MGARQVGATTFVRLRLAEVDRFWEGGSVEIRERPTNPRDGVKSASGGKRVSASSPSSGRARVEGDDLAEVLAGGGARMRRANVVEGEAALIEEGA